MKKTIYYTKYALTKGISKHLVQDTCIPGMLEDASNEYLCFHEGEYFFTIDEAFEKAYQMKEKKIKSVKKQLKKLNEMTFKVHEG